MKKLILFIKNNRKRILVLCIITLIALFIVYKYKVSTIAADGWSNKVSAYENSEKIDLSIKETFLDKENYTTSNRYEKLFKYFAYGNIKYQSPEGAFIYYPGEISIRGRTINGIEGFARFFPLAASWLSSNHSESIVLNNESFNIISTLKRGLMNGTNPKHSEYWGDVKDKNQRIVEAADIALALWISKDKIWNTFTTTEKDRLVKWLNQSVNKKIVDNNWNLFPITIVKALEALGYSDETNISYINILYKKYKNKHYLGEGWFDDPPKGIDYYNAWSIHYSLFWLDQIDPTFDRDFIRKSHFEFVKFYKYLFSENGFPIMGRSVCYRLAAPAPIVTSALIAPEEISAGFALRTLDLTWSHFIKNDALQEGKLTQGYYKDDLRLLDGYSGAGSCLWSLRSLIVAFYVDKYIPLFKTQEEILPIETSDFKIENKTIGWAIIGDKSNQKISLQIEKNINNKCYKLKDYSCNNKLREFLLKNPSRPNNNDALYKNYIYTTENELFITKQ
ncbi:DUF2264 domain-containing protein [Winogradskyella forsetii]|uniref:DUF2264 domain-containing protein n=1 Tax=Winogradskyella forsetii TaxID=2686077 RepID=UPI0015BB0D45|nr:DUF2264 domain-containing protein [Winogradskyella forsetii]